MKLSAIATAAFLPLLAFAQEPTAKGGAASLHKRAITATVAVDGLRYRRCPRTSCDAVGQYAKGTRISIVCYTRENTTPVNGDAGWAKLTSGYWVAFSNGDYLDWSTPIPYCS